MPNQSRPPHLAFTYRYPSRQESIITPCGISNSLESSIALLKGRAIWDTGATSTVISPSLVHKLKLIPVGKQYAQGIHESKTVNMYVVNIQLPNKVVFLDLKVIEANIGEQIDVLIGMDIIGSGDFSICGANVFSYSNPPFENPVDFVEKAEKVNKRIRKDNQKIKRDEFK